MSLNQSLIKAIKSQQFKIRYSGPLRISTFSIHLPHHHSISTIDSVSYLQTRTVCVGSNHCESISWLIFATNCKRYQARLVPCKKELFRGKKCNQHQNLKML